MPIATCARAALAHPTSRATRRGELGDLPPWLAFERRIFVKREAAAILRRELRRPARFTRFGARRWSSGRRPIRTNPPSAAFASRAACSRCWPSSAGLSVTIITKSPLVTRDVDVLMRIAAHSRLSVHISLITTDRELARRLEPRAPTPEARLRAIARLRGARDRGRRQRDAGPPGHHRCAAPLDSSRARRRRGERVVPRRVRTAPAVDGATAIPAVHRSRVPAPRSALPFDVRDAAHQVGERYRQGLRDHFRALCATHGVVFDRYYKSEDDEEDDSSDRVAATARDETLQLSLLL